MTMPVDEVPSPDDPAFQPNVYGARVGLRSDTARAEAEGRGPGSTGSETFDVLGSTVSEIEDWLDQSSTPDERDRRLRAVRDAETARPKDEQRVTVMRLVE